MTYDLTDPREYMQALDCIQRAKEVNAPITLSCTTRIRYDALTAIIHTATSAKLQELEITRRQRAKTLPQNSYLHLLCQYFASEYGCSTAEAKEIYLKRQAAPEIFQRTIINKHGRPIVTYRSIADLSIEETSSAIRNFIDWAALGDIELPMPSDKPFIRHAEREIEKTKSLI